MGRGRGAWSGERDNSNPCKKLYIFLLANTFILDVTYEIKLTQKNDCNKIYFWLSQILKMRKFTDPGLWSGLIVKQNTGIYTAMWTSEAAIQNIICASYIPLKNPQTDSLLSCHTDWRPSKRFQ